MTNPINHHPASTMVAAPNNQLVFLEHVDSTARRHASPTAPDGSRARHMDATPKRPEPMIHDHTA